MQTLLHNRNRPFPVGLVIAMVLAATIALRGLDPTLSFESHCLFDIAVAVGAWYGGKNAGLLAVGLSFLAIYIFHLDHPQTFGQSGFGNLLYLVLCTVTFLVIAWVVSDLHNARLRAEQLGNRQVKQREEQLQIALMAAQMGIWQWDMVKNKVTWSPEHEQIFGLEPGTFDGKYATFESCIHPDDRATLHQVTQKAIKQRSHYQHEYRVVWEDGSEHWVEERGRVFHNEIGEPVKMTGVIIDIDARKQTEENLRRYERIVAATPDLVALVDRNYTHQIVNRAYMLKHQKQQNEIIGCSIAETVDEVLFAKEIKPRLDQALAGDRCSFQTWHEFPTAGNRFLSIKYTPYLEPDQSISGVVVNIRDLTELKRIEEELREKEEYLRSILQNMPVMLDAFDADGNIICWNKECERVTGFSADEVIGNPRVMELFYPDETYRNQMLTAFRARGNNYRNWEWEITSKDGSPRTISWSNLSNEFPVPGWSSWGIGIDVTGCKQLEPVLDRNSTDLGSRCIN
jgi:PAS domain S-box-containing protein